MKKKLQVLRDHDQLITEQRNGNVFSNFSEHKIHFTPTYKFDNNQPHTYYSETKNRVPAWCDRILWSSWEGSSSLVEQQEYVACHEVITSDHSPIHGVFKVSIEKPWIPPLFTEGDMSIIFYNLTGHELRSCDLNGLSDPYLRLMAPYLLRGESTTVIEKNLNPIWEGETLVLIPLIPDSEFLRYKSINIEARDQDLVGSDLIGRGTVALSGKLDGKEHPFEIKIWKHGTYSGTIKGNMTVMFHTNE